jgi:hypothetical protein
MRDDSGNLPHDPYLQQGQPPGREPLHAANGPAPQEHVASGPAPAPARFSAPTPAPEKRPTEQKDAFREIVETVVFVVVLVLLLKAFLAEAFVIPTGSMATTLLGYHREITCPQCGQRFPLNLSKELDPQEISHEPITGCECPNCHLPISLSKSEEARRP